MNDESHPYHRRHDVSPLFVGLFGVIAGAIIVATLHCILLGWCKPEEQRRPATQENRSPPDDPTNRYRTDSTSSSNISNYSVRLIQIFKYSKGCKHRTCAICLGEFKEDDELRLLPECAHHFHVPCIDMWLYSHPNCPLCRADVVSPRPDHVVSPRFDHVVLSLAEDDDGAVSPLEISMANHR